MEIGNASHVHSCEVVDCIQALDFELCMSAFLTHFKGTLNASLNSDYLSFSFVGKTDGSLQKTPVKVEQLSWSKVLLLARKPFYSVSNASLPYVS